MRNTLLHSKTSAERANCDVQATVYNENILIVPAAASRLKKLANMRLFSNQFPDFGLPASQEVSSATIQKPTIWHSMQFHKEKLVCTLGRDLPIVFIEA